MLPGFLIGLREGLEAALIVGLTLSILTQTNQQNYRGTIWGGVISAAGISLVTGLLLFAARRSRRDLRWDDDVVGLGCAHLDDLLDAAAESSVSGWA